MDTNVVDGYSCDLLSWVIPIDPKTLQKAEEEGVAILSSDMNTFELSGVLYQLGIGSKR